ncbi:MAG TPA: DUF5010 domain-containing protein [Spirochaetota bacterium]|nr:DUF5010 domain-containing protein [Spirochaetota bacterium]
MRLWLLILIIFNFFFGIEHVLKPEFSGPFQYATTIDVNRGHAPEVFVRAAYWQAYGSEPANAVITEYTNKLISEEYFRRIDAVNTFAQEAGRIYNDTYYLTYSDPWQAHPPFTNDLLFTAAREVGAVWMIWAHCPAPPGYNCGMDWANTHALGMDSEHSVYGFPGGASQGYETYNNPGFYYRELLDGRYAGLSFMMPNIYGPDCQTGSEEMTALTNALLKIETEGWQHPVKIAMFDDTWGWGRSFFPWPFTEVPDCNNVSEAADYIYEYKWKKFFEQVPSRFWYEVDGRPFVYFYNGGTLINRGNSAAVINECKNRFQTDFGVEPFVVVDTAFWNQDSSMDTAADGRFKWYTFEEPGNKSRYTYSGKTLDHAMVKWDDKGRATPGAIAQPGDHIDKRGNILDSVLAGSADADILVLATWNDLGEGTSINRNYDYYIEGEWKEPDYFMKKIRNAQGCDPLEGIQPAVRETATIQLDSVSNTHAFAGYTSNTNGSSGLISLYYRQDQGPWQFVGTNTNWSLDFDTTTVQDGFHVWTFLAVNTFTNSNTFHQTNLVDNLLPVPPEKVSLLSPAPAAMLYGSNTIPFSWSNADDNNGVAYYILDIDNNDYFITNTDALITNQLLGHWPLQTSLSDISPNSRHGTVSGNTNLVWIDGPLGKAIDFSGNQTVDLGAVDTGNEFTVTLWARVSSAAYSIQGLVANGPGAEGPAWRLFINSYDTTNGKIIFETADGSGWQNIYSDDRAFSFDTWHHLAVVINKNIPEIDIYMNGEPVPNLTSYILTGFPVDQNIYLGSLAGTMQLLGAMDDVRIYSDLLTPAEISTLYHLSSCGSGTEKIFNKLVDLIPGEHTWRVRAVDIQEDAGPWSGSRVFTNYPFPAPYIAETNTAQLGVLTNTVSLGGIAGNISPGPGQVSVYLSVNSGNFHYIGSNTIWSTNVDTLTLPDGLNIFTFRAQNSMYYNAFYYQSNIVSNQGAVKPATNLSLTTMSNRVELSWELTGSNNRNVLVYYSSSNNLNTASRRMLSALSSNTVFTSLDFSQGYYCRVAPTNYFGRRVSGPVMFKPRLPQISETNTGKTAVLAGINFFSGYVSNSAAVLEPAQVYLSINNNSYAIVSSNSNWSTNIDTAVLTDGMNVFAFAAVNKFNFSNFYYQTNLVSNYGPPAHLHALQTTAFSNSIWLQWAETVSNQQRIYIFYNTNFMITANEPCLVTAGNHFLITNLKPATGYYIQAVTSNYFGRAFSTPVYAETLAATLSEIPRFRIQPGVIDRQFNSTAFIAGIPPGIKEVEIYNLSGEILAVIPVHRILKAPDNCFYGRIPAWDLTLAAGQAAPGVYILRAGRKQLFFVIK